MPYRWGVDGQIYWDPDPPFTPATTTTADIPIEGVLNLPGNYTAVTSDQARPAVRAYSQYYANLLRQETKVAAVPQEADENDMLIQKLKLANPFKVGADPEFIMLNADGSLFQTGLPYEGAIGTDHGGRIVELRPTPSRQAYRVVRNINKLLHSKTLLPKFSSPKWRAGGRVNYHRDPDGRMECLGGHVHIGTNYESWRGLDGEDTKSYYPETYARAMKSKALSLALDRATKNLEDLDILNAREAGARRTSAHGYGRFGDCRVAGDDNHLEYRTPHSWLYSPVTSFATLTTMKLAALEPSLCRPVDSFGKFMSWVEGFASADMDAARLCEKFTTLPQLQADPDADIKATWPAEMAF